MLGQVDWDKCQEKYREFWARENKDRPLLWITAPQDGVNLDKIIPHQPTQNSLHWISGPHFFGKYHSRIVADNNERWLDTGQIISRARENFSQTFYAGESFPLLFPDLGADIMGGIMGCELDLGENTTWCKPIISEWSAAPDFKFQSSNKWWKNVEDATRQMVEDAKGDYFVSITDIHPGVDSLVAMRGPEELCIDLIESPEIAKKAIMDIWEPFKEIYERIQSITINNLPGSSNWMGVWHPGRWHVVSADFMTLISKSMFSEFVLPEIRAETEWLDASIFHLDGPGTLRHLDFLLELDSLTGIAWLPGEGKPPISEWIPILQKIQRAGKVIQAEVHDWEIPILVKELEPAGVMYITSCKTKDDAIALMSQIKKV